MLEYLHVENLALIDELSLDLHPGLNVFTGETGAGKTMLVGAVNILVGGRTDASLVRAGAEEALVEAVFATPNAEDEGGELSVSRSLLSTGRSRSRMNGAVCTVSELASSLGPLIDLHGQHEHQSLLSVDRQRALLDRYAGRPVTERLAAYRALFEKVGLLREKVESLSERSTFLQDKRELLEFQVDEIEKTRIQPGEDEALEKELGVLRNAEKLVEAVGAASALLSRDETGAIDLLRLATTRLEAAAAVDGRLDEITASLREAMFQADACRADIERYLDALEFNPGHLAECEERASVLAQLKRKYGDTLEGVMARLEDAKAELESLDMAGEDPEELGRCLEEKTAELMSSAEELSQARRAAASALGNQVGGELEGLGLKGCEFEVRFLESSEGSPAPGRDGLDDLRFMIAPNPGEAALPLARSASGGELSRIMLALRIVLAAADEVPVLVFDEIDAGIGGATAAEVGERLAALSGFHQVICVTHLPQIAAFADAHFAVRKEEAGDRMVTRAEALDAPDRVKEIARMLSGAEVSPASIRHAEEMLETARASRERRAQAAARSSNRRKAG